MKISTLTKKIIFGVIWIIIWEGISLAVNNTLLLPSPIDTILALKNLVLKKVFYLDILMTSFRWLTSVIASFIMGAQLSWYAYRFKTIKELFKFPMRLFKAIPVMAVAIYIILIAKSDWVAVIVAIIMCLPIIYTNILTSLNNVSNNLKEVAISYELTKYEREKYLYIPSIKAGIKSSIELTSGIALKAIVASEILSIPKYSLGYEMLNAKYYLNTSELFAYILVIIVLSLVGEHFISVGFNKLSKEKHKGFRIKQSSKLCESYCETIKLKSVFKSYGGKSVLNDFSLNINTREKVALVGPSGIGKTTVLKIIAGFEKADSGDVLSPKSKAIMFQEPRLFPNLNIYENLALSMEKSDAEIRLVARALELEDVLKKFPAELSGGMQSRVSLGRALLKAGLLILDEPFTGLDKEMKVRIIENVKPLIADRTCLIISHDEEVISLADRVIELR